jgi:hypothetical protein
MTTLFDLFTTYGPYIAISLVISFVLTGVKRFVPFFTKTVWGKRILYWLPAILGAGLGALLLTEDSIKLCILYGAALGTVSQSVYSIVTKGIRAKGLEDQIARESTETTKPDTEEYYG